MPKTAFLPRLLSFLLPIALLSACASTPANRPAAWADTRQLVLVTTADWNATTGTLRRFERSGEAAWREVGAPSPITVGRNGAAWGIGLHASQPAGPVKQEGDGRAPAGVFRIGTAFGYADRGATAWPYQGMTASDWCIDVNASPLYNRIVDARQVGEAAVAGSTEPMRRDLHAGGDQRYKLGFVIEHNPDNRSGAGSCIFAHLWKAPGETTAGCTAMAEPVMQELLAWLKPDDRPVFVLLPVNELERLAAAWQLPPAAPNR
jgi:L,D-peptidoglycan transpeptidase YkuD (ErfK/YbiS/YcfS/YnhG family)